MYVKDRLWSALESLTHWLLSQPCFHRGGDLASVQLRPHPTLLVRSAASHLREKLDASERASGRGSDVEA